MANKISQPRIWTTKTYDRLSRYYDLIMKVLFPIGETGRVRIVEKLISGSVLDIACGTGTLVEMAHKKGLNCYGVDISEGMLAQARQKVPEAQFKLASFYEIPFPDKTFDHVVATNALSGTFIDANKVLSEMIRVCKVEGSVYIAEWPKAEHDTLVERLTVWLASLNDDAPKDYMKIFRNLGYKPEVDILSKRYHILGIKIQKD